MSAKESSRSLRNATGSITTRTVAGEPPFNFRSSDVGYSSSFINDFFGVDKDESSVSVKARGVTGAGQYEVGSGKPVSMEFYMGYGRYVESGTIVYESYVEGRHAKGTFDVVIFYSGVRVQGTFDVTRR